MVDMIAELRNIGGGGTTGYYTDIAGDKINAHGLLIGVDGDLQVTWASGRKEVIPAGTFTAGMLYDKLEIKYIWSTGTTAGQICVGFDRRSAATL